ncbi:periplasmic trehalase [Escherichia coli]|uniref:Periplasmic trehalase n=1 Tax=Escherichia coli TaxID=562 RepID=A0A484WRT2_ECOLX|nr:periplasmic trehalase [Escherichia coli]
MMSAPPEQGAAWRISITGWLWLDQWRDAENAGFDLPKEQPCDNVPATRPLSESTTQPLKQKEAEPTP